MRQEQPSHTQPNKPYMARKKKKEEEKDSFLQQSSEWYADTSPRLRAIFVGIVCLLVALFFTLVIFNTAGSFGEWVRGYLFMTADNTPAFLGWSFITLIILLTTYGIYLCFAKEPISYLRLIPGGALVIAILAALFTAGSDEIAGGILGSKIFIFLQSMLGVFSYVLMPLVLLSALYILKIFSPIAIWEWLNDLDFMDNEEDDKDEDEDSKDEDEYEYEEGGEDEYEEDEEDEDEDEESDEEDEEGGEDEDEDSEDEDDEEEIYADEPVNEDIVPYSAPPFALLNAEKGKGQAASNTRVHALAIQRTLQNFKINVEVEEVIVGPSFTRYSVRPAEGVRLSRITSLQQNLELALAAHPIRIEAPIPGKSLIGIEVPNFARAVVGLQTLLKSKEFTRVKDALGLVIGKTINGSIFAKSLEKMPHILVAGTTGSGKSVLIHNFILSLLFNYGPRDLRFIFIDPKRVELTLYKGIPHLYTDPITDPKKALHALAWIVTEMERRYELLEARRARDISSYNQITENQEEHLPYLVVIIDELADLMQSFPREIEANIVRIAQKSRAVGIHLIISTQRPSVNIITGIVKANIPVRIALQVASSIDSRTILDATGAENLIGAGDLLFSSAENKKPVRAQSAFVTETEVKKVVGYLLKHNGVAEGIIDITKNQDTGGSTDFGGSDNDEDELYPEALRIVAEARKASTSLLQRKLKIGYSRAARLIDMLEENGIVGQQVGSKPREILVGDDSDGGSDGGGAGSNTFSNTEI